MKRTPVLLLVQASRSSVKHTNTDSSKMLVTREVAAIYLWNIFPYYLGYDLMWEQVSSSGWQQKSNALVVVLVEETILLTSKKNSN